MIEPPHLNPGDKIKLISTARKIEIQGLQFAINTLTEWGYEVVEGETLTADFNQFAGNDSLRAQDLQSGIDDESIKAILCIRGGYGTIRIIDKIDFTNLLKNPKWIVGYSDITVLHSKLNSLGLESLHATMPINFAGNSKHSLNSLRACLSGSFPGYQYDSSIGREGACEAEIVGGNLSVLCSLLGSDCDISTKGKILFIEDLDEYLYHIDRMMMAFKRSGKLIDLVGIIVGGMTDMNDNKIPFGKTANEIIMEHVEEFDYPVCFGFPAGHISDNRAIVFNKKARLTKFKSLVNLAFLC